LRLPLGISMIATNASSGTSIERHIIAAGFSRRLEVGIGVPDPALVELGAGT
jgi:hypothetical protein